MIPEKHDTLKKNEDELKEKLKSVIYDWEKSTGIWVTDFKYHKDCQVFSVELHTGIKLEKGMR